MLEFYSFDNFDKFLVLPILGGFMLLVNALVYQGLVPPMSKLRHEQATDPGDSPKKEVVLVEEPVLIPSPTTLKVRPSPPVISFPHVRTPRPPIHPNHTKQPRKTPKTQLEDFQVRSGHRIPATAGLALVFRDLEYSIGPSQERATRILKGVSGHVAPGQMCALMGGSGAGAWFGWNFGCGVWDVWVEGGKAPSTVTD